MLRQTWGHMNALLKKMKTSLCFLTFLFSFYSSFSQPKHKEYSFLFFNTENLFDVRNDSLTNDDEFTPQGERHWNRKRLSLKLQNTAKVILSAGGWSTPVFVGLCEIENRYVLESLCNKTPLHNIGYKIIHKESPDYRGIDVAALYDPELFYPLAYKYFPVRNKKGEPQKTRELLYVSGVLDGADTLHVFINHWPSRYSGVLETREYRADAARELRRQIGVLLSHNKKAKIIVLGDFNDQPKDVSINDVLGAKEIDKIIKSNQIYNLSTNWQQQEIGTLKYQSQWFVFDQIMVSGALLKTKDAIYTKPDWAAIYAPPFLLEEDKTHGGMKPKRTYVGFRYNEGFSDHFPVVLKLKHN